MILKYAILLSLLLKTSKAICPHLEDGLLKWSDASTWDGGVKPGPNTKVVLSGKKVLLDESPPPLSGIEILSDSVLVWNDQDDIKITTDYILNHGRFQIGSPDCRFTKKANIVLTGRTDDGKESITGFGRKFYGATSGSTTLIYGEDKISWTKLARTIPASSHTCGVVYDHQNTPFKDEWGKGIHVMVWNEDGSFHDFVAFTTGEEWDTSSDEHFVQYVNGIKVGKIVALAVRRGLGIGEKDREFGQVYEAVEKLGGMSPGSSVMRNVAKDEAYAFITLVGNSSFTNEQHAPKEAGQNYTRTDNSVRINYWEKGLVFSAQSAVKWQGPWGTPDYVDFKVITADVAYPKIDVISPVNWQPDDQLVFASTDYDLNQAEERTVFPCLDCNSNQFRVDGAFQYSHYGEVTEGVDERGEVGLLSRNIRFEGQMEPVCYGTTEKEQELCSWFKKDTFGGHFKVVNGFNVVHVEGAEFKHMGQQFSLGNYPIHFHMCDDVDGTVIKSNSIHHTLARCITIHGTDGLNVTDNICFEHLGHGFFLEDAAEIRNILDGNLGINTRYGGLLLSDRKREWCNSTNKDFCAWFINSDRPLGPSWGRQQDRGLVTEFSSRYTPVTEFYNNVAHSNNKAGLFMDNKISYGQYYHGKWVPEGGIIGGSGLNAKNPPNEEGEKVTSTLVRFTGYKNRHQNAWLRAGNLLIKESSNYALQGFIFYDGPVYSTNCHFRQFKDLDWSNTYESRWGIPAHRPAGAYGFLRKNRFTSSSFSQTSGATFSFCDETEGNWVFDGNGSNIDFGDFDGDLRATFLDKDGSVTGHPGVQVVKNIPFLTTPRCSHRPDWQMMVCPHGYVKNKSYTIHFNGKSPKSVKVYTNDLEMGDFIRVGVCFPKDSTQFKLESWYPWINTKYAPSYAVNSIEELDSDLSGRAYFWDQTNGLFFVKFMSNETRGDDDRRNCPNGKCPNFKITRLDGGDIADCLTTAYGPYKKNPEAAGGKSDAKPCTTSSGSGIGAGETRSSDYTPSDESTNCPVISTTDVGDLNVKYRGCYKDDWNYRDLSFQMVRYFTSMTRELCVARCQRLGYVYAGLQKGDECRCGNNFGKHGADPTGCTKPCSGAKEIMCGGNLRSDVFATGNPLPPEPARCGPGSRGIIFGQKCYYMVSELRDYMSAQRECVIMGGNLASVTSVDEQLSVIIIIITITIITTISVTTKTLFHKSSSADAVAGYLRQGSGNVWFGLNDVTIEGTFEFVTGEPLSYNNFLPNEPSNWWSAEDYGVMKSDADYKWDNSGADDKRRFLCQLPTTVLSSSIESCGFGGNGMKIGSSGKCYAIINGGMSRESAEYKCFTQFGVLAPMTSDADKNEIISHLYKFGIQMDYWVGEKKDNDFAELVYNQLFKTNYVGAWDNNGAVCLLGNSGVCPQDVTMRVCENLPYFFLYLDIMGQFSVVIGLDCTYCEGWVSFQGSCYLYTSKIVGNYEKAQELCNGGNSNLVSIESKEENDFVFNFVKKYDGKGQNLYLGYRYSSMFDKFRWTDGSTSEYSNWADGNGKAKVSGGTCARMRSWDTEHKWENTNCDDSWLFIVCKAKMGN
ncbi:hypothetical protein LOTGIDRAFT_160629 [Lottia gigantea]|uniref:Hyaluronoglucosaminidase n=1 Tax=Lottia gigantea TaxID=225164 RepID=V4APC2_LOTGI|nr:hypothetical protein LOTGIDRAFT_160629 [Lottia gigantea]ESO95476.1 hypothetical protein LOTGIDRAFT_160629 [Lottia gigantea]